jgi:hypothetical protein
MGEKMYIIQFEAYFAAGTPLQKIYELIRGVDEQCPFQIRASHYDECCIKEVGFVDNCTPFDPKKFMAAVQSLIDAKDPCITCVGAYLWCTDPDHPTWSRTFRAWGV